MAGSYHGQVHEENLKRLEEFHQVSPGYIKFLDTEDFAGDCNE